MPCPFTGPKMFCAGPNFLSQPNNLFTHCQTFCARQKDDLHLVKLVFVPASFWRGTKCSQIFGLAQKIWTGTKHFGTCKRTRHQKRVKAAVLDFVEKNCFCTQFAQQKWKMGRAYQKISNSAFDVPLSMYRQISTSIQLKFDSNVFV